MVIFARTETISDTERSGAGPEDLPNRPDAIRPSHGSRRNANATLNKWIRIHCFVRLRWATV